MESIKQVLMRRDNMTASDAEDLIQEAKELLQEYLEDNEQELAFNICAEFFGLEPDYVTELF